MDTQEPDRRIRPRLGMGDAHRCPRATTTTATSTTRTTIAPRCAFRSSPGTRRCFSTPELAPKIRRSSNASASRPDTFIGNPNLRPERSRSLSASVEQSSRRRRNVRATGIPRPARRRNQRLRFRRGRRRLHRDEHQRRKPSRRHRIVAANAAERPDSRCARTTPISIRLRTKTVSRKTNFADRTTAAAVIVDFDACPIG